MTVRETPQIELSLIIPTYNERENLPRLVEELAPVLGSLKIPFEVIVVDDDSPDGTWAIAEDLRKDYPFLRVIRRQQGRNLGAAVVEGFQVAQGRILGVMDADRQHPPQTLLKLHKTLQHCDIAVASRHLEGGGVEEWPLHRRLLSLGAEWLAKAVLPPARSLTDPLSGFFLLRREVIESVDLQPHGYKILLEILARGRYQKIREIPYVFRSRKVGSSALNLQEYAKYAFHLAHLLWNSEAASRFLRFCLVGAAGSFVNLSVLGTLTSGLGVDYRLSAVIAVEASILFNFAGNSLYTFRDAPSRSLRAVFGRMLSFHMISAGAILLYLASIVLLVTRLHLHYMLAGLIGIAAGTLWNFFLNLKITWSRPRS